MINIANPILEIFPSSTLQRLVGPPDITQQFI